MKRLGKFALALAIGLAGALVFLWLGMPLPFMLGSMTACAAAALLKAPIGEISGVRPATVTVIGVFIGSSFYPGIVEHFSSWLPIFAGLLGFMTVYALLQITALMRLGRLDFATAYCAGMPGGLAEMITLSEEYGGDGRMVALIHGARIFLIVLALPQLIAFIGSVDLGQVGRPSYALSHIDLRDVAWLFACAIVGYLLGRLMRLPAAPVLGPMLVSAAVHLTGVTAFVPPTEIVTVAQLLLGTLVGTRFVGTPAREFLRVLALTAFTTVLVLMVAVGFATGVSQLTGVGMLGILMAYSPGGLAEMSLLAYAIGIEVAFVATQHVFRVFVIVAAASFFMRWTKPRP